MKFNIMTDFIHARSSNNHYYSIRVVIALCVLLKLMNSRAPVAGLLESSEFVIEKRLVLWVRLAIRDDDTHVKT